MWDWNSLLRRLLAPQMEEPDEEQRLRDYNDVFSTPAGRRVLEHICRRANMVSPLLEHMDATGRIDPSQMLLNEGARMLALDIVRDANQEWFGVRLQRNAEQEPEL